MNTKILLVLEALDKASGVINGALGGVSGKLDSFSKKSAAFGRSAMAGAVAIGAPLGIAVNDALNFEDKLGNIATIIDTNKESISEMGDRLLSLSKRIPVALDDLNTSLYDIRSAGIDAGQAFGALEDSAKLSVGGLSTVAEATDIMTSAMNAFKNEGLSSSKIADILFKTTAYGKTTVAQMAQAFGSAAPIINAAGVKLADFSAATAAMTTGGVPASQAQNQLRAAVVSLMKPSADMEKIFNRLGVSTGEELFKKFGNMGRAFEAVKGTAEDMDINLAKATGSVEALGAVLSITGATNDVYTKSLADMQNGTNMLEGAFEKQSNKGKARIALLRNNLKALSVSIGNILLPVVSDLVKAIGTAATWLSDFSERYPRLTKVIVIAAGALAAFLAVMGALAFAASAVAGGMSALAAVTAFLAGRFSLAAITQKALTMAHYADIAVTKIWTVAKMAGSGALNMMRLGLTSGIGLLRGFATTIRSATVVQWLLNAAMLANPIGLIIIAVTAAVAVVAALVAKWHALVDWFKKAPTPIKILVGVLAMPILPLILLAGAIRWVMDNWDRLPAAIKKGVNAVVAYFRHLWDTAVDTFNSIVDFVASIPEKMFEAGKNIINSIVDGIKSVAMAPLDAISGVVDGIREYLPFSPAKRGALRDIHRVKIVETVADTIKPGPMVKAMSAATAATMMAVPAAASKVPVSRNAAPVPSNVAQGMPMRSGAQGVTINFAPQITVNGGGASAGQKLLDELKQYTPELLKMLKAELEKQNRRAY